MNEEPQISSSFRLSPPARGGDKEGEGGGGVIEAILLPIFLFLLPWQTRWIFEVGQLSGGVWEYGTLGIYATEILLWIIVIASVAKQSRESEERKKGWRLIAALFLGYIFLSAFRSPWPHVTLFTAFHFSTAFVLFFLLSSFKNYKLQTTNYKLAFIAGALLQVILGLVQFATQKVYASTLLGIAAHAPAELGASVVETADGRLLRAYGGLPHPNILGGYLVVALLLTIDLLFRARKKTERIFLVVASLALASGLFATFSRSAWLGFFIGLILFFYRDYVSVLRRNLGGVIHRGRTIAPILIAVAIFAFIGKGALAPRFMGESRLEEISRTERMSGVKESLAVIRSSPWIGVGLGNYTAALANLAPGRPSWSYQPVHNVPLLILAELGLIGLILLLFVLSKLPVTSYQLPVNAALITIALFDHYLWSLYPGLMLTAIALSISLREQPRT